MSLCVWGGGGLFDVSVVWLSSGRSFLVAIVVHYWPNSGEARLPAAAYFEGFFVLDGRPPRRSRDCTLRLRTPTLWRELVGAGRGCLNEVGVPRLRGKGRREKWRINQLCGIIILN